MPEYMYAEHGSVTPYLSLYPGLFNLYDKNVFVTNKPKLQSMPATKAAPRRESHGLRWVSSKSRFSSPTEASSRTSSTRSSAPYLYTFYDDESSQTSPPQGLTPTRLPKPVVVDIEPAPRRRTGDRKRRATLEREPSGRSTKRERSSSTRRKERPQSSRRSSCSVSSPPATFYVPPRASYAEPVTTYVDVSPLTPSPRNSPPASIYISPPINPTPPRPLRRKGAQPLPRITPLTTAADEQPPIYVQRRNAVKRDGKTRAVPLTQTDPAIPLPELTKLDKLLDQMAVLVAATITAVGTQPSARAPKVLSRNLQDKLNDLVAYQGADANTLLPDQNAPAARWHSGLRLFPGIKSARDALSRFDGLGLNPPRGGGDARSAARWRALQRVGKEPNTAPRRSFLPSLMAVVAAQTVARHVLVAVELKGRQIGNPYRAQQSRNRRPDPLRMHSGAPKSRARAYTAPAGPVPRVVESRWDPETNAGVELGMPTPLALRLRRLERMDLRFQRVLVAYGEAVWGRQADVPAWLGWVRETMVYEGFLKR